MTECGKSSQSWLEIIQNQLYSKEITILSSQIEAITAEIFSKSLQ